MNASRRLFALGWCAVLIGGLLAHLIQTSGGIRIQDVRFTGVNGKPMSGLLYVPPTATAKTPAPGILAVHGYINSRETQSGFAIEYARRGHVVLALDQTGHGYSAAPAFADGFGGPAGLNYLRNLDIVDAENIGLEGHSMGGGSVLAAALAYPDGYKSLVLEGSATRTLFSPPGDARFPRNLAVVFSRYDEFSQLMWSVPRAVEVTQSPKLLALFDTKAPVVPGRLYGSLEAGTARVLYTPGTTHPGDHISPEAIGDSVEWFQRTLVGGSPRDRGDQIWWWKEIGTLIAFGGFVAVLLGAFDWLLGLPAFMSLRNTPTPARERRDASWWIAVALTALIPVLTFYPFMHVGSVALPASKWLPQGITNQILAWAILNAVVTLALGVLFKSNAARATARWGASIAIALGTVSIGYVSLVAADYFFKIDFRFWVVALKLLSADQFAAFLVYVVPFTAFFLVAFRALQGFIAVQGDSTRRTYVAAIGALAGGFALFILAQYAPLFAIGHLLVPAQALNAIISIQFLPLMIVLALISVFTWRRTNSYVPGALISGLFVTWYIVAGTATHIA
jgi:pimeloyl-ACP methyl ester carboxylesterase